MGNIGQTMFSIGQALSTAGVVVEAEEIRAEAEIMVEHLLDMTPTQLVVSLQQPFPETHRGRLEIMLRRRLRREPLRYIVGECPFYGRMFGVTPDVLIPREETELLVDRALLHLKRTRCSDPKRVADIGTGSGIIAITMALEAADAPDGPVLEVHAVDVSPAALGVAKRNASNLAPHADLSFHEGDLFSPLEGRFDVIIANLPYVQEEMLEHAQPELAFEPRLALYGGASGMDVYVRLAKELPGKIARGGRALFEIDPSLMDGTRQMVADECPGAKLEIIDDFANLPRSAEIQFP